MFKVKSSKSSTLFVSMYARYIPQKTVTQAVQIKEVEVQSRPRKRKRSAQSYKAQSEDLEYAVNDRNNINSNFTLAVSENVSGLAEQSIAEIPMSQGLAKTGKVNTHPTRTKLETGEAGINSSESTSDSKELYKSAHSNSFLQHKPNKRKEKNLQPRTSLKDSEDDEGGVDVTNSENFPLVKETEDSLKDAKHDASVRKHKTVLSKFESSKKAAEKAVEQQSGQFSKLELREHDRKEPSVELHGLGPIPQPKPATRTTIKPSYSILPQWLAKPITISSTQSALLSNYNIDEKLLSHLKSKGFIKAFSIQAAIIPMLLSGSNYHDGDICIAAPTGSGKTLSYVLPMVERLRSGISGRLRSLIVVPTRELVAQAREVCEICIAGSGLRVGTAVGNRALKVEQDLLISPEQIWSPKGDGIVSENTSKQEDSWDSTLRELFQDFEDLPDPLPDHVVRYRMNYDILICTPGRLVEHIQRTRGFSLKELQYLVIDEADRLLDESFQDWVEVVMKSIYTETPYGKMSMHEQLYLKWSGSRKSENVTKVVLSATMTRDIQKLKGLKLRKPRLVVLEGLEPISSNDEEADQEELLSLPSTMVEWAVPVGDGSDKPRYLLHLIDNHLLLKPQDVSDLSNSSMVSETDSENSSLVTSSNSSKDDSSSENPSEDSSSSSSSKIHTAQSSKSLNSSRKREQIYGVLIFTSSNAAALRLTRLLSILKPDSATQIATLTSTLRSSQRRKTLARFRNGSVSIIVASDLAARGLDISDLAHVVNYDIPASLNSYVHRVGRTARAGKSGQAWTLITEKEARWFWRSVARASNVERLEKIKRLNVKLEDAGTLAYEEALSKLGEEVTRF